MGIGTCFVKVNIPLHWATDLAAERGEAWLVGYLRSCPELRALILRLIGLEARDRGLFPPT